MADQPTYQDIVERLAPCGLDCERCVRYERGRVKRLATELATALKGFGEMAPRVADRLPVLREYGHFAEILEMFGKADCRGCRAGEVQFPMCAARTCFKEKAVDFCFQCDEYPCERNQYPEELVQRLRVINDRIREVGVEAYYLESQDKPRY